MSDPPTTELAQVRAILSNGEWWSIPDLTRMLLHRYGRKALDTSVSARIREIGGYDKRRAGKGSNLYLYRLRAAPAPGRLF